MKSIVAQLIRIRQALTPKKRSAVQRPPDARVDREPWLKEMLDVLGERYRLGDDTAQGIQVLCRTGKERFNPMRVWLSVPSKQVAGEYDVRVAPGHTAERGRALLDARVTAPLSSWGLHPTKESSEEWSGLVITRRYEGTCPDASVAAAAVAFLCRGPESVMNTALEG